MSLKKRTFSDQACSLNCQSNNNIYYMGAKQSSTAQLVPPATKRKRTNPIVHQETKAQQQQHHHYQQQQKQQQQQNQQQQQHQQQQQQQQQHLHHHQQQQQHLQHLQQHHSGSNRNRAVQSAPQSPQFNEQQCLQWFEQYRDPESPLIITPEGTQKFFDDLGISVEDVIILAIAWKMNASTMGEEIEKEAREISLQILLLLIITINTFIWIILLD
ncbi:hypothetical protein J3Q64DRAFT_1471142 [Phycomyces blakesleeanus]|uniref:Defective in cullin neddylation protein n=1 Tax=Phycomyces blakesleeanus TaxID=4837 RepID=A0ABR3B364_PHYBL